LKKKSRNKNVRRRRFFSPHSPFVWVAVFWCLFGGAATLYFNSGNWRSLGWFLLGWTLCLGDLLALVRMMDTVMPFLKRGAKNESSPAHVGALSIKTVPLMFWGTMKLVFLGLIGWFIWSSKTGMPHSALLMSLATLIVVPLVGGYWWSQRELDYA
jgi:hypothetical protein